MRDRFLGFACRVQAPDLKSMSSTKIDCRSWGYTNDNVDFTRLHSLSQETHCIEPRLYSEWWSVEVAFKTLALASVQFRSCQFPASMTGRSSFLQSSEEINNSWAGLRLIDYLQFYPTKCNDRHEPNISSKREQIFLYQEFDLRYIHVNTQVLKCHVSRVKCTIMCQVQVMRYFELSFF